VRSPKASVSSASSLSKLASHTVCQSTPRRRATAATEAVSRWMQLIAHHAARVVMPAARPGDDLR
jgi:hypothetical protein